MSDPKPKKLKPLTRAQQRLLAQYRREGFRLYGPEHRPNRTLQILIERGLIMKMPGLLGDEIPQGYAPAQ
jgi:hypothetical protein